MSILSRGNPYDQSVRAIVCQKYFVGGQTMQAISEDLGGGPDRNTVLIGGGPDRNTAAAIRRWEEEGASVAHPGDQEVECAQPQICRQTCSFRGPGRDRPQIRDQIGDHLPPKGPWGCFHES